MTSLVFMVEERSMAALLEGVLPRIVPTSVAYQVVPHEGKSDLKKSLPRKLTAWGVPGARFVVLIDQDSNNCKKLKAELRALCDGTEAEPPLIRIVCRSLESWVIGDLDAVAKAFEKPTVSKRKHTAKLRKPDQLGDPLKELRGLVEGYKKVDGARTVAPHLNLARGHNASVSFGTFCTGLEQLIEEMLSGKVARKARK